MYPLKISTFELVQNILRLCCQYMWLS